MTRTVTVQLDDELAKFAEDRARETGLTTDNVISLSLETLRASDRQYVEIPKRLMEDIERRDKGNTKPFNVDSYLAKKRLEYGFE